MEADCAPRFTTRQCRRIARLLISQNIDAHVSFIAITDWYDMAGNLHRGTQKIC